MGIIDKLKRKYRKIAFNMQYRRFRNYPSDHEFPKFTADWLIHREIVYGGIQRKVRRRRISPHDPRTEAEFRSGSMRGGDRMLFHGYAKKYSEFLGKFEKHGKGLVVAEFGILRGNGLAIWCDLFPDARILGFDIDTSHFEENRQRLIDLGAFSANYPEIYKFDQFEENRDFLQGVLKGDTIDVCIDDGCHMDEAILCTMNSVLPHLSDRFVYFVEDNESVYARIERAYPQFSVSPHGQLTVIYSGL